MDIFDSIYEGELEGIQYRAGQANMALDIAEAFSERKHLMVEASVGIGKSYGYLIPGLIINQILGNRPIIIATSSIHLSEQLLGDVKKAGNILGRTVRATVGKGKEHYSCLEKAVFLNASKQNVKYKPLLNWVLQNEHGDRGKINFEVSDKDWSKINVDKCSFEKCLYKRECHFYNMRTQISDVGTQDVIIINQDLLIADLIRKYNDSQPPLLATRAPLIIIDEAHNLETKVRNALTNKWSLFSVENLLKSLDKQFQSLSTYNELRKVITKLNGLAQELFKELLFQIEFKKKDPVLANSVRFAIDHLKTTNFSIWKSNINKLSVALTSIQSQDKVKYNTRVTDELYDQVDLLWKLIIDLEASTQSTSLLWTTYENKTLEIHSCPKDINTFLKAVLYKSNARVVLTSATLCQPSNTLIGQYQYIAASLGFSGEITEPKYAEYPYDNNCRLYIANDVPLPSKYRKDDDVYFQSLTDRIITLANMTEGRTLVLFTAKDDLTRVHEMMQSKSLLWPLYVQKEGASQSSIVQQFRDTHGVLLGTGVYWEGLDIRGEDLSQVIIVRLPFPVPDPVIDYKASLSSNPQSEVLLPEMLIKLRQGVGRLIRSESDKGVISILDSRLGTSSNKWYKDMVFSSLPMQVRTESLDELGAFIQNNVPRSSGRFKTAL